MKIESSEHLAKLQQLNNNKPAGVKENSNNDFSKLLSGMDKSANNGTPDKLDPQAGIGLENNALTGLILASRVNELSKLEPRQQLEQALEEMEIYVAALGDNAKTLKEIEPLADAMQKTAGHLSRLSQNMSSENPLKGITNEAAVLATVEAMKFKRGDYI